MAGRATKASIATETNDRLTSFWDMAAFSSDSCDTEIGGGAFICSGHLTSAQRCTMSAHYSLGAARGLRLCLRSAEPARDVGVSATLLYGFGPMNLQNLLSFLGTGRVEGPHDRKSVVKGEG